MGDIGGTQRNQFRCEWGTLHWFLVPVPVEIDLWAFRGGAEQPGSSFVMGKSAYPLTFK